jgi:hypothetical protein
MLHFHHEFICIWGEEGGKYPEIDGIFLINIHHI